MKERLKRLENKFPKKMPEVFVYATGANGEVITEGALAQTLQAITTAKADPEVICIEVRLS